ncbi:WD40 repeat domain-containing protein [Nostoc sp.]
MNINLDLPPELENELFTEATRLNLPLPEYILRILSVRQVLANPPKTGAELVAYWQSEGVVVFSPDGKILASSDDDGDIILWDMQTGLSKCTIQGHSSSVRSLGFSSNGQLLVSGDDDGYVKIWNLTTGTLDSSFYAHSAGVSSVAFCFNNQVLVSSSWDKTVKLWVLETAIPKPSKIGFFKGVFGKKQPEAELIPSLPNFILQQVQGNSEKLNESIFSSVGAKFETEAYSFCWETSQPPVKNPQLGLEDWERLLRD